MAKPRKSWYKAKLNVLAKTTVFTFTNEREVTAQLNDFSDDIQLYFALHGMKGKFGDLVAPARDKGYSVDEAATIVQDRIDDMILTGDWNKSGTGGGTPSLVMRAMVEHLPHIFTDVEAATKAYGEMAEKDQVVIRQHLEIKELVKKYQLETATQRVEDSEGLVDLSALFAKADDEE